MTASLPILYSFRRCPYAIRARLAIKISQVPVVLREVVLADKPDAMLAVSPKGTVPVLALDNSNVLDESMDIMMWALNQNDPDSWLINNKDKENETKTLIAINDNEFKQHLDHYKYADQYPANTAESYRQQAESFLQQLEINLSQTTFILSDRLSMVDMAIFPFIRQFAFVDKPWFDRLPYKNLQIWLKHILTSDLFTQVMMKQVQWKENDAEILF